MPWSRHPHRTAPSGPVLAPRPVPRTSPTCRRPRALAGLGRASPGLRLRLRLRQSAPSTQAPWVPIGSQRPRGPGKALRGPVSYVTGPAAPDPASTLPPATHEAHWPEFPEAPAPRPRRPPSSLPALSTRLSASRSPFPVGSPAMVRAGPSELALSGLCTRPVSAQGHALRPWGWNFGV